MEFGYCFVCHVNFKRILGGVNTVNPVLSPLGGGLFFASTFEGGLIREGGLFNLAKRITGSKNTVV